MQELDYLTIALFKKSDERKGFSVQLTDGGGLLLGMPQFVFEIQKELGFFFKINNFKSTSYSTEEVFIYGDQKNHYIHFRGRFFLRSDYQEKVVAICKTLQEMDYQIHLTRVDLAITKKCSFVDCFKSLLKSNFHKTIVVSPTYKNGEPRNFYASNTRLEIVFYDKTKQINTPRRKSKDHSRRVYKELFQLKYGDIDGLSRLEFRLQHQDTLRELSDVFVNDPAKFFELCPLFFKSYLKGRVKFSKKIKNVFIKDLPPS